MFWPSIVLKLFYILCLYEICFLLLVDYFHNILICQDALVTKFCSFQGVMLYKNGQKWLKINISSTFQAIYDCKLFLRSFILYTLFFLINQLFNLSMCLGGICDQFLPFQGGHVVWKWPKMTENQHFLHLSSYLWLETFSYLFFM